MTLRLLILTFLLPLGLIGDSIPLESVPWTAGSYYTLSDWQIGKFLSQQYNRSLPGTPFRINGVPYNSGIGSWVGNHTVYHIAGAADSFACQIGFDDATPFLEKNPMGTVSVFADSKLVCKKNICYGKLTDLNIDLRGKELLQFWFTGIAGHPGGYINIVNAAFKTSQPERLRKVLNDAQKTLQKNEQRHPVYPEPPQWKKVKIRRIAYGEFKNAYRISNDKITLVVLPEFGGRLVAVFNNRNENFLAEDLPHEPSYRLRQAISGSFSGGHFMRFHPLQSYLPQDVLLSHGAFDIKFPEDGRIVMTSPVSSRFLVQYQYEITVSGSSEFTLTERIINHAKFSRELGIWSLNRINRDILKEVNLPDNLQLLRKVLDIQSEKRYMPRNGEVTYKLVSNSGSMLKISYLKDNPENSLPAHYYSGKNMFELEFHGGIKTVAAGQFITCSSQWKLHSELQK